MNNTTLHLRSIPPEKFKRKIWRSFVGIALMVSGYVLLKGEVGPTALGTTVVAIGGFLLAGDLVRTAIPVMKDIVDFAAWAIRKIQKARKGNGK